MVKRDVRRKKSYGEDSVRDGRVKKTGMEFKKRFNKCTVYFFL